MISSLPALAAKIAASFNIFAKSAPTNPGVFLAITDRSTSLANFLPLAWTFKISSLPLISGLSTTTCLSNLPGLIKALSNISGLFVAAKTIIVSSVPNPSISTRSWFKVCSLSSFPPPWPDPLFLPTASISSINMIHGALFLALLNRSLTLEAPTPTNISTNSDPDILKNGTLASPATALASKVLPVPGPPNKSTPLGILAPIFLNFSGSFKKLTTSSNSTLASGIPATSAKVTFEISSPLSFALDFPILKICGPPPLPLFILFSIKIHTPIRSNIGNQETNIFTKNGSSCGGREATSVP